MRGGVLALLLLSVFLAAGCGGASVPADGDSCIEASEDEFEAWVGDHEDSIPKRIQNSTNSYPVRFAAEELCDTARNSGTSQNFSDGLFEAAVALALKEHEPVPLSPAAKRFLEEEGEIP